MIFASNRFLVLIVVPLLAPYVAAGQALQPSPDWMRPLAQKLEDKPRLSVLIEIRTPEPGRPSSREVEHASATERTAIVAERERRAVAQAMPAVREHMADSGIDVRHVYEYQPFVLAEISRSDLEAIAASPDVVGVFENIYINQQPLNPLPPRLPPTEIEPDRERALLTLTVPSVNADKAWAQGYRGQGQSIAVLDSGIDASHEMFRGKIAAEACFSDGAIYPGYESLCPESRRSVVGPGTASFCPPPRSQDAASVCMHGSHVAGIAAGDNNNAAARLRGVAPEAKLIPIQVFTRARGCANCLGAYTSDLLAAMDWVAANAATYSIASVNMSLGGRSYAGDCAGYGLDRTIQTLRSIGVVVAIASGNDGYAGHIAYPGCVKDAFSVGSVSATTGRPSYFTNTSTLLDLYAPGEDVNSAIYGKPNGYARFSGTSMSTPHVAGAVAVLKSKMPTATAAQLEYALRISGPRVAGLNWSWSNPRLDLEAALEVLGQDPPMAGTAITGLFPGDTAALRSIIRVINPEYSTLPASITLVQETPRAVLGTHRFNIPEHGSVQYSVRDIENAIRAQALPNTVLTAIIAARWRAYAQHVVMDANGQMLSNMTVCGGEPGPSTALNHVNTSAVVNNTSHIIIMNNGGTARRASFALYNAFTGWYLGVADSPVIDPNSSIRVSAQTLFDSVDHGQLVPRGIPRNIAQVNMFLSGTFNGVANHTVHQTQIGLITDMTPKCMI